MLGACIHHLLGSQWCVKPSLDKHLYQLELTYGQPDTTQAPGDTGITNAGGWGSLLYNEYICYNIAQVRLRYLLRVHT